MTQESMYYFSCLVIIVTCGLTSIFCLEEGDPCTLNGRSATCTGIFNCPTALEQIQKQHVFPQTCGFAGTVPIVCCAEPNGKTTTTPRGTRPTATTTVKSTRTTSRRRTPKPTVSPYTNPFRVNTPGYKSYEKCVEYSNYVIAHEKPPILYIDKEEEQVDTCGFKVVPLIIGGVPADRKEFPHMALIGYNSEDGISWMCGGTLISDRYVLTAGHCLVARDLGDASHARLGVTKIDDPNHRQDIAIIERIKHPNFESPSHYNDIGLMKLEKAAKFDAYVRPACLYFANNPPKEHAVATGWGKTDFVGYSSDELLKVTLEITDTQTCNNSFKRVSQQRLENGIREDTQVCAGSPGKDTCQGDSGGPLQIYSDIKCMYEIIGVTSFGKACGIGKSPGVYTRVSFFIDWVEKIVWP